jgi:hypothetical protein
VTTSGYDPGGVAAPPGDFGKLAQADIPTAMNIRTANDNAQRGRCLNVHITPQSAIAASSTPNPPASPPGIGPKTGVDPWQNVSTTIATSIAFPVKTIELGTILQVMFGDGLVHPSCTVPVVPGRAVSANPNTALPPGVVFTVEGLPGATEIVTGELPLLNVAVTVSAAVIVTEQPPVPVQPAPLHPANVDPSAATAVSATTAPLVKFAEQVSGQMIPAGALVTVPAPVPASVTVSENVLFLAVKLAVTAAFAVIVNVQVPVPSQSAPPHPANVELAFGAAVSVIAVPLAKFAAHVVGQLIPAGLLVTVPPPVPASVIVSEKPLLLKFAVTDSAAVNVIVQAPVPSHPAPVNPVNVEPVFAVAFRVTVAPLAKFAAHVVGQLIPAGLLVTVPAPVPASVTVSETPEEGVITVESSAAGGAMDPPPETLT